MFQIPRDPIVYLLGVLEEEYLTPHAHTAVLGLLYIAHKWIAHYWIYPRVPTRKLWVEQVNSTLILEKLTYICYSIQMSPKNVIICGSSLRWTCRALHRISWWWTEFSRISPPIRAIRNLYSSWLHGLAAPYPVVCRPVQVFFFIINVIWSLYRLYVIVRNVCFLQFIYWDTVYYLLYCLCLHFYFVLMVHVSLCVCVIISLLTFYSLNLLIYYYK